MNKRFGRVIFFGVILKLFLGTASLFGQSAGGLQSESASVLDQQTQEPKPSDQSGAAGVGQLNIEDSLFRDVAGEFRCPTCQGLGVLESDAPFSVQIKDTVRKQLSAGKSKEQIIAFFVERYGPWILRAPPKAGVNSLIWALPLILLSVGPIAVWLFFWKKPHQIATFGARSHEEILQEMERELDQRRREVK